jgi:hypothetical protein
MSQVFTSETVKELLVFPFRDDRWRQKLLVAFVLSLTGFVIPFIPTVFFLGFCAQIMRRIILENGEPYLPEWDEWGQLFRDGLRFFAVGLIYMLPAMFLIIAGYALMIAPMILTMLQSSRGGEAVPQGFFAAQLGGMIASFVIIRYRHVSHSGALVILSRFCWARGGAGPFRGGLSYSGMVAGFSI